jgi:hypothetical protein
MAGAGSAMTSVGDAGGFATAGSAGGFGLPGGVCVGSAGGDVAGVPVSTLAGGGISAPLGVVTAPLGSTVVVVSGVAGVSALATARLQSKIPDAPTIESSFIGLLLQPRPNQLAGSLE